MNKQLILVEFHNCSPFVYEVQSEEPITIERVWEYFEETEGINDDRDSITFIEEISTIKL